METLYPWQQRYTFIDLLLIAYKPYIWNIYPLGKQQYLVVIAVLEALLPWQLRITFIIFHSSDNELHAWQTYSFLGNFIKWFTGQY